ncbi:hypothetical protein [Nocardia huaxiensis]|uniref:hypothetical protein n=1 Tax=Nocardia huaxiensis TaxID=2755382 RepID=UPI001E2E60C9|nr:hypothetical protein [Nocardia huaxiensis]UFS98714.1 hypothetical protein LPY97_12875 [Nocardia huaxiensis]
MFETLWAGRDWLGGCGQAVALAVRKYLDSTVEAVERLTDSVSLTGAAQPPAAQCTAGEAADALLAERWLYDAESAYRALLDEALADPAPHPLILAKAMLGLLMSLIMNDRADVAYRIWSGAEQAFAPAVAALERGQVGEHDRIAYALVGAFFQAGRPGDRDRAGQAVDGLMTHCLDYARRAAPGIVPRMINNWRRCLTQVFDGTPPPRARERLEAAEQLWGQPIPEDNLLWLQPSAWIAE